MFDNNPQILNRAAKSAIPRFLFVKQSTTDDEVETAGTNEPTLGVTADYDISADEGVPVVFAGGAQLQLGATVTAGDRLKSDSSGRGVKIAVSGTTNQQIGAIALRSGVVDDPIPVLVIHAVERPAVS